jgi:hypothetical protein
MFSPTVWPFTSSALFFVRLLREPPPALQALLYRSLQRSSRLNQLPRQAARPQPPALSVPCSAGRPQHGVAWESVDKAVLRLRLRLAFAVSPCRLRLRPCAVS